MKEIFVSRTLVEIMVDVMVLTTDIPAHALQGSPEITVKLMLMNVSTIPAYTTEHVTTHLALIIAHVLLVLLGNIVKLTYVIRILVITMAHVMAFITTTHVHAQLDSPDITVKLMLMNVSTIPA